MKTAESYEDIIGVHYPVPTDRPRMSMHDRAAQFSPFAALSGYDELIEGITAARNSGAAGPLPLSDDLGELG